MIQFGTTPNPSFRFWCKRSIIILSLLWLTGLLLGFVSALNSGNTVTQAVCAVAINKPNFLGTMLVLFLPVIVLLFGVYYKSSLPLYIYCPMKAFAYIFSLCATGLCFGDSAWLIRFLLFFSDSIAVVFILLMCYRLLHAQDDFRKLLKISSAAFIATGLFDYFCISPYLVMLLNYS